MKKIPRRLNILGHEYEIKRVPQKKMSGTQVGGCQYPVREIRLSNELRGEMLWLIFLHEIRHAYQYESGLTQTLGAQMLETDCELFATFISSLQKQGVL